MKKSALYVAIAFMAAFAASAWAENDLPSPSDLYPSSVGAFGSSMLGGGLSYQRWQGPFGYSVAAGGSSLPYSRTEGSLAYLGGDADFYSWSYNLELDLMYKLFASNFWDWLSGDLFAYLSLGHTGGQAVDSDYNQATQTSSYSQKDYSAVFAAGLGIGYEITLFRHFSLPIQFGYTVEWPMRVDFTVSGGLRYRF